MEHGIPDKNVTDASFSFLKQDLQDWELTIQRTMASKCVGGSHTEKESC